MYPDALIIEPMKINHIPKGKEHMLPSLCESGEYFGQLKKDGYWYMFERTENNCYLFSRNKSVTTGTLSEKSANVPHIIDVLQHLEPGTILIGEIYYPGKRSEDVTPIMGSLPEKAIERQKGEYGYLHYYIHDILRYKNKDLIPYGASIRYEILKAVYNKLFSSEKVDFIELAERVDDNLEDFINQALANGEEGVVLKKKTAPYTPGKRPAWDTIKIKQTATCDAICLGFGEPTKYYNGKLNLNAHDGGPNDNHLWNYWAIEQKVDGVWKDYQLVDKPILIKGPFFRTVAVTKPYFYGWKTSMNVGAYDADGQIVPIGSVSSGLTEDLQSEFAIHGHTKYVGEVVELSGMQKNNDVHTLRHFFFKRFRDDKDATECTIKNIFL